MSEQQLRKKVRVISRQRQYWYAFGRMIVRLFFMIFYSARYFGQDNIPPEGAVLIVEKHKSYFDPALIGAGIYRHTNYLARKGLFKFKPFAKLIDSFDAIPLNNEGIGFEGMKETIKRLKNGEMVLMFPEGERCWDGKVAPFKSGFLTFALRGQASILPVAIEGVFEAWPRFNKLPGPGHIKVKFGELIPFETARAMNAEELHDLVEKKVHELFESLGAE